MLQSCKTDNASNLHNVVELCSAVFTSIVFKSNHVPRSIEFLYRVPQIEIIPEIFHLENQFGYFCKAGTCSYFTGSKTFDSKLACQGGVQWNK